MITTAVLLLCIVIANCDFLPPTPEVYEIRESPAGRLYLVDKNDHHNQNESPLLKLIKGLKDSKRQLTEKQLDVIVDVYKGTEVENVVSNLIKRLRNIRQSNDQNLRNEDRLSIDYYDVDDSSLARNQLKNQVPDSEAIAIIVPDPEVRRRLLVQA